MLLTKEKLLRVSDNLGRLQLYSDEFAKVRYSVYFVNPLIGDNTAMKFADELQSLWPSDSCDGAKAKDKPRQMSYSKAKNYPAWHYNGNWGYPTAQAIAEDVADWLGVSRDTVRCEVLRGWRPSSH